jgi:ketosteroid isomerase-like protein
MSPSATAQAASSHPVLALEHERCAALVQGDLERTAALLDPELVYVHAPGTVHDRAGLLDFLREKVRYASVERRGLKVHARGGLAWVTGLMRIEGQRRPGGEPILAVSFVTQVWREDGHIWRMVLLQSTKVDDGRWAAASEA